ncbi:Vacuolar calcium ion transporter [Talaromyces islandicus]|uniref:Vacuolar calcium ion transporter n=1 Tax=Talaromyces islandicus TaxID=28573 RepID=A0A0U1M6R6_TALIS|nr:Vacuolar calcium ion transporter [Talaromyces islandicus]
MKLALSMTIVPVALAIGVMKIHPAAAFSLNLAAVIPLSVALTMATESLARDLGPTAGALLNISCGNLAEIIILTALSEGHVRIVQASLLGSLLVNLLLVLGLSLVVAGLAYKEQSYDDTSAQLFIGQLNLTVFSFILPTAFYRAMSKVRDADNASLAFSRAVSVILLLVYAFYLVMHLKSHESQSDDLLEKGGDGQDRLERESEDGVELPSLSQSGRRVRWKSNSYSGPAPFDYRQILAKPTASPFSHVRHSFDNDRQWVSSASYANDNLDNNSNEDEEQRPVHSSTWLSRACAIAVLCASTFVIGVCADTVVDSFRTLNERGTLRESFVGLIILPVAGNIAEVITSAMVASKGEIDLAINVAVGSAIQIGVLVTPLTVLAGWAMRKDMSLHFNGFETVAIVAASLMVSFLLVRGKANHFEGVVLIAAYAAVSIGAFLLPDSP